MFIASSSPVAAMNVKVWTCVYRVERPERNKRTEYGVWSEKYIEKVWRGVGTSPRLLLPQCQDTDNAGIVVVPSDPTMRLSDKDFQFVKDDIKLVKYSWYYLMFKK